MVVSGVSGEVVVLVGGGWHRGGSSEKFRIFAGRLPRIWGSILYPIINTPHPRGDDNKPT